MARLELLVALASNGCHGILAASVLSSSMSSRTQTSREKTFLIATMVAAIAQMALTTFILLRLTAQRAHDHGPDAFEITRLQFKRDSYKHLTCALSVLALELVNIANHLDEDIPISSILAFDFAALSAVFSVLFASNWMYPDSLQANTMRPSRTVESAV